MNPDQGNLRSLINPFFVTNPSNIHITLYGKYYCLVSTMGTLVTLTNLIQCSLYLISPVHSDSMSIISGCIINQTVVYIQSIQYIIQSLTKIMKDFTIWPISKQLQRVKFYQTIILLVLVLSWLLIPIITKG